MKQGNWWARLYLMLALIIVPAFIAHEGFSYFALNRRKIEISNVAQRMVRLKNDIAAYADDRVFWVYKLSLLFNEAPDPVTLFESCQSFFKQVGCRAELAVYSAEGTLVRENISGPDISLKSVKQAGADLKTIALEGQPEKNNAALSRLSRWFGKDFFMAESSKKGEYLAQKLYINNLEKNEHYLWLAGNSRMICFVRIPDSEIKKRAGLRFFCDSIPFKNLRFHFMAGNGRLLKSETDPVLLRRIFRELDADRGQEFIEAENRLFSRIQLDSDFWMILDSPLEGRSFYSGRLLCAFVLLFLFLLVWLKRSGIVSGYVEDWPLMVQILMLISISAGIPMAVLGSVAINYFTVKKTELIRQKNQEMAGLALRLDKNLRLEQARCGRLIRQTLDEIIKNPDPDNLKSLLQLFRKRLGKLFANGQVLRTTLSPVSYNIVVSDLFPGDEEIVFNLGKQHLAALNSVPPDELPPDKSYILEMIFQRPLERVIHDLLQTEGTTNEAGWGAQRITLFHQGLQLIKDTIHDHFLLIVLNTGFIQESYMMRHLQTVIRNDLGVIFFICRGSMLLNEQKSIDAFPELFALFNRTSDFPLPEPEIIEYEGQRQLFVGLNGSYSGNFKFCLLYPLALIEKAISDEAEMLFYPVLLGFLMMLTMMVILHMNLLQPVAKLHQAARALEERDSNFRLPVSSGDEFSEMAGIFNKSISEFDELKIASIVQSRLLPASPLVVEGFSLYGQSIPMVDLGGDYFDYFIVDDDHFVLLLGDVAGHGVGASLIMAMAKAGVICGQEICMDPAGVLSRLHQIVFAIKNRVQRKVMTFQYLLVKRKTAQIVYSNAGGCSPVLIDKTAGKCVEISHSGAVLGGFKKSVFSNLEFSIRKGQALILYTDGIVESRNAAGRELGYNGLYDLFLRNYDTDASVYYQNIMTEYRDWLGGAVPGDDMTLIVMVCNASQISTFS